MFASEDHGEHDLGSADGLGSGIVIPRRLPLSIGCNNMHILSDSVLAHFIRELHEKAKSDEVSEDIFQVMEHIGEWSPYRGGRKLLQLLADAIETARINNDKFLVEALTDALNYANGKALEYDLEIKYDLNPYRDKGNFDIARIIEHIAMYPGVLLKEELYEFLNENTHASPEDTRRFISERTAKNLNFVRARRAGYYGAFRMRTHDFAWVQDVLADRIELVESNDSEIESMADAILQLPDRDLILQAIEVRKRLDQITELEHIVSNPNTKEESLQRKIQGMPWIFGGRYARIATRRLLWQGTQVDLPLVRADGVLHVVELKVANTQIVKKYRSGIVPNSNVNDAISQVENYLRTLDEERSYIVDTYGIDPRRARGTVMIGHPDYQEDFDEAAINEALRNRTYIGRVDVMTYKELIDSARRSLALDSN
ncbi:Shedu anti-phage system protein SduA domain-containing protein [Glycomyces sp. NPDC046736]|uniref:Shedu anti-phage system protein SduA domain-containing protein n=1 Tax=Glycomyces sp. NPDC046736 TaxID=3155615 RepID=UPI0033E0A175